MPAWFTELAVWFSQLTPATKFFFALPFIVAAVALGRDWLLGTFRRMRAPR